MSSCLWPMESYDFTVLDFKSITWNKSEAMVNKQTKIYSDHLQKEQARHGKSITVILGVTHSQCPVDTQVQRDQHKVV